jgi:hypothetical protein
MHIQDFHSKLTQVNDESHLLVALRSLSRIEDPRMVFNSEDILGDWPQWPALGAHGSTAASTGV